MKRLRIGRRRAREVPSSPLELALAPALDQGRWQVPPQFNYTRDVVEALAADPKRRALTFLAKDGVIEPRSFVQLADGAGRWAAALRERNVQPGDRVAVVFGANADWLEALLGCLKAGAVAVPCAPTLAPETLRSRLATAAPTAVLADADLEQQLEPLVLDLEAHLVIEGATPADGDAGATEDTAARDLAFLFWSSGTTGAPKPVAHTHGATFAARAAAEHWLSARARDTVWCMPSCGTAQVLWTILGAWACGAEAVLADGELGAADRLDLVHRLNASVVCATPAELRSLTTRPEFPRFRSPRLRRLVSYGDHLELDVAATFLDVWDLTVHEGYGQSETGVVVATTDHEGGLRAGTMGRPLPGHQLGVIDHQGNEVEPGTLGDLAVRGRPPTLFAGYWESPEDTKEAFRGDWYVTGDVAVADEDGFLAFVARDNDVISSMGVEFGPLEIERTLREHRAVRASAVVGLRDLQRGGQFVRAFVVLEPGVRESEPLGAELRQVAADALPEQQVPREVEFVPELPTSATGAVLRQELRERPITGRPLWDLPPTSEPDPTAESPHLAPQTLGEPFAAPFVAPPEPEPLPEYVVQPPPPAAEPVEPEPEPVAVEPVAFVEDLVPPEAPDVSAYVVDRAHEQDTPVAFVEPETFETAEPLPVQPEPVVEAATLPDTAPPVPPEPDSPAVLEPETAVVEQEPEAEAEAPLPEYVVDPAAAPEPPPVVPEPDPELPAEIAPGPLPEYVVDPVTAPAPPPVEPEPTPEPEPVPLPEYVVDPDAAPAPVASTPPSGLEPEPEVPAGPLPEYVVDPERPATEAPPEPLVRPPAEAPDEEAPAVPLSDLGLKPVTHFPTIGETRDGEKRRGLRRRPSPEPEAKPRRERSTGDPGDEASEISWMQGLSNRLSAYSVTPDDEPEDTVAGEHAETGDTEDT